MAGAEAHYQYASDDGTTYKIKLDASNAVVTGSGCVAATTQPALPKGYHPRHVWVADSTDVTAGRTPTNRRRKLTVCTAAGTLFVGTQTTATLPDFSVTPSVAVSWNNEGKIGERRFAI